MGNLLFYFGMKQAIVASAQIHDRVASSRRDFQSQVDSSNLCHAAEELLRLISELKVATIVQEVSDSKQESFDLRFVYDKEVQHSERIIAKLSESVYPLLESLEQHYYRSCTTWGFAPDAKRDADSEAGRDNAVALDANMTDD